MTKELYIFNNQIHFDREPIAQLIVPEHDALNICESFISVETSNEMEDKAREEGESDGLKEGWKNAADFIDDRLQDLIAQSDLNEKQKQKLLKGIEDILIEADNEKP